MALLACALLAVIAALPWALGTPPARRWLQARADRALAPGGFHVDGLRLSWFGPTRMTGLVLRDAQGDPVVASPRATWDRNLWQILFERPRYGTLTLSGATLDVERRADGSIDLLDPLRPLLKRNPKTDLSIALTRGVLRLRGLGLAEPVAARDVRLTLRVPPAPGPLTWRLDLANPSRPGAETLSVQGRYDRWRGAADAPHDLEVHARGRGWPLALALAAGRVEARGRLEGRVDLLRRDGLWSASGAASVRDFDAAGGALAGDHLRLDPLSATWDVAETAGAWTVRRLELDSPLASIGTEGQLPAPPGTSARIAGRVDLAALARQLPHALAVREGLALDRGTARLRIDARTEAGRQDWDVEATVSELIARDAGRVFEVEAPATLLAHLVHSGDDLRIDSLGLKTPFLDASARGDLENGVVLKGKLDLGGLVPSLDGLFDFGGLELAGRGELEGRYRRAGDSFEGQLAADLGDLDIHGLTAGGIRRDAMRLDLTVSGPTGPSGLPRAWQEARIALASGGLAAEVSAEALGTGAELIATASSRLALGTRDARAEVRLEGHWDDRALTIREGHFGLAPPGDDPAARGPIALSARGRFDGASGELRLEPIPGATPGPIALAPEGLRVSGLGNDGSNLQAEGAFVGEVAALARALASGDDREPADLAGTWSAHLMARGGDDGLHLGGRLDVADLSWPDAGGTGRRGEGPLSLAVRGLYRADADRVDLVELVLASRYAALDASGSLSDPGGRRLVDLHGTLAPDWETLNAILADRLEPGARLKGRSRGFHVKGPLAGASAAEVGRGLEAELGFDLIEADCFGMRVGPTPIVVRIHRGRLAIDPIRTTLNRGQLRLDPEVELDDGRGPTLRLAPGSAIEEAEINPEVAHRVLAFVAPVLRDATRPSGLVSARVDRAEFPIGAASGRRAVVEGQVVFRDVEFAPGPLAQGLLELAGRRDAPPLKLDQPVTLSIADGRVVQRGLAIPLGNLTQVELEGAVDFDRNLDLTASLPIMPAMFPNRPLLRDIVAGTRISVPIRGTLSRPRIDREAFNVALGNMGRDLLERTAVRGATELLMRLARPSDPNAPPPLSREERRARQLEKKAQRRRDRAKGP